jgi:hypothetical protein
MRGAGVRAGALLCALVVSLSACSDGSDSLEPTAASQQPTGPTPLTPTTDSGPEPSASSASGADTRYAVSDPGRLRTPLRTADLLVTSSRTIPGPVLRRVGAVHGVAAVLPIALASLSANGRTLSIAAGDPGQFRRFTQYASAVSDAVWRRVAGGEIAVDPSLPPRLVDPRGYLRLGTSQRAPAVHVGAYAPLVKQISAFVNLKRARQLGMPRANALLVSTGELSPSTVTGPLRSALGPGTTISTLAVQFHPGAPQTAVLSGGSVSSAVGTFTYTPHPDGTITQDPQWVRTYIRQESVPVIGTVTCNKGMLPQLRGALTEVVQRGLAKAIDPAQYGGCYVPRFIAHDPSQGLSLHSWGMAVDLNVPGNQRGTVGRIDRRVVAIFKRWGFAWGGDWSYSDPMHFEMDRVVRAR